MAALTTLEEDVLHLICEYLPVDALKSASQAHRALSRVYLRHCLRHLEIVTSTGDQAKKNQFLNRCERGDYLKHIRHLTIEDTSQFTQHSDHLLRKLFSDTLPKLTGLRTITWNVARNRTWKTNTPNIQDFCILKMPPSVELSVKFSEKLSYPKGPPSIQSSLHALTSGIPGLSSLVSLQMDIVNQDSYFIGELNRVLSASPQLRHFGVKFLIPMAERIPELEEATKWTASDVARFPALKSLKIELWGLGPSTLMTWAAYGDWSSLEAIKVPNDLMLQYMVGQTPRLRSLTVDQLCPWLPDLLLQVPQLSTLVFTSLREGALSAPIGTQVIGPNRFGTWDYLDLATGVRTHQRNPGWVDDEKRLLGKEYANIAALLRLPLASKLTSLRFNLHQDNGCFEEPTTVEAGLVASLCPHLTELTISVAAKLYHPEILKTVDSLPIDWIGPISQAIAGMPCLSRLEVVIPRCLLFLEFGSSMPLNPGYVTMASLEQLLESIRTHRPSHPSLTQVTVTCVLGCSPLNGGRAHDFDEWFEPELLYDFQIGPTSQGHLTFIATLSENQDKATQGEYVLSCPELKQAEDALKQGNHNMLLEDGHYSEASKVVDDIEALAYRGVLA